jgi:hypothetical protein
MAARLKSAISATATLPIISLLIVFLMAAT